MKHFEHSYILKKIIWHKRDTKQKAIEKTANTKAPPNHPHTILISLGVWCVFSNQIESNMKCSMFTGFIRLLCDMRKANNFFLTQITYLLIHTYLIRLDARRRRHRRRRCRVTKNSNSSNFAISVDVIDPITFFQILIMLTEWRVRYILFHFNGIFIFDIKIRSQSNLYIYNFKNKICDTSTFMNHDEFYCWHIGIEFIVCASCMYWKTFLKKGNAFQVIHCVVCTEDWRCILCLYIN